MPPTRPRLTPAIADLRRAVRAALPPEGLVLVALSGGPDSLALAAAVAFEAPRAGLTAGAVIVDHGLQPGSTDAAARAGTQAAALGLNPVVVKPVTVGTDGGPEAAARTARSSALERAAAELDAVAVLLGHTLDDQAETVLLGLGRGSGARSLAGMPAVRGAFRRPLLGVRRAGAAQACADLELRAWQDPANADPRFARVRVRELADALEAALGPGTVEALARSADLLRADADALDALAAALLSAALVPSAADDLHLRLGPLLASPVAVRRRALLAAARRAGCPAGALGHRHALALEGLLPADPGAQVHLPGGVRAERRTETVTLLQ